MPRLFCLRQGSDTDLIIESDPKTDWKSIYIAALVAFIGSVHTQCLGPAIWPYMQVLIPGVSETFYGGMLSLNGAGMVIAGLLAGWISNLLRNSTPPMLVAKILALISCLIYISIEVFNQRARPALFLAFLGLLGFASGAAAIYASHIAMASTEKDRAKAVAICSLAPSLGIFIGPAFQLIFAALGDYPGIKLIFGLHLNMYTAPVYLVFAVSSVGALLLIFSFDGRMRLRKEEENEEILAEVKDEVKDEVKEEIIPTDSSTPSTSTQIPDPEPKLPSQPIDKVAVCICFFIRMITNLSLTMFNSIGIPYMMLAFGWSSKQSLLYISICLVLIGILICMWNLAYIFTDLKKRLSERRAILIGVGFLLLSFLCTYPWFFIKETIPYKMNDTDTGCPRKYQWCAWTPKVNMYMFMASLVVGIGIAIPLIQVNMDILFSKVLGNIKQGTLQGAMIASGNIMTIIEPLVLTKIYTLNGPTHIWEFVLAVIISSIVLWLFFYKRMIGRSERLLIEQESTNL